MLVRRAGNSAWSIRSRRALGAVLAMVAPMTICIQSTPQSGWVIPAETAAAGARLVEYDGAPPWDNGAHCAGGLTPGAIALGDELQRMFPQIERVNGYDCRPNTALPNELSQHGTGRALDLAIPTQDGKANNELGDPVANWLVEHSTEQGVQLIIWDRTIWHGDRSLPKHESYTGPDPHIDHIHVELTEEAAAG